MQSESLWEVHLFLIRVAKHCEESVGSRLGAGDGSIKSIMKSCKRARGHY